MRFMLTVIPIAAAFIIAACSPPDQASPTAAPVSAASAAGTPAPGKTAPANPALGSPEWYAWVDKTLAISDDGHGPRPESPAWNQAVNAKLGQEAPQAQAGSAEWQQAVDALLRTRVATH
jgi:hypothetical protein